MALPAGSRVGPYEILTPLGAGGMGEVYRARDARLARDVALKILNPGLLDAEHLRRFELEARATGALNHPNILVAFDTGTHEGWPYVVSELLDGQTLRQRLADGPLPVRKVLDLAAQIARGLAAAHDRDIVHRDLKPENVFVTRDGVVKILDFGLAKQLAGAIDVDEETGAITADPATDAGRILGTVGYMSPEQARGQAADERSDIFSYGAVLYEMLSGCRAFRGETSAETLTAILKQDPPALSEQRPVIPPALARITARCLEKRPGERFQSARDLAFALEGLSDVSSRARGAPGPAQGWPRLRSVVAGVALAVTLATGLAVGRLSAPEHQPSYKLLTFRRGVITGARFAPDGRTMFYSAAWDGGVSQVYSVRTESPEAQAIPLPPAMLLSVSSKGEMAVLLTRDRHPANSVGTLARVPLAGGTPREVLEGIQDADWSPDGEQLCVLRVAGEEKTLEFPPGKVLAKGDISWPRVSPKGDRVAFIGDGVEVVDLAGKRTVLATQPEFMYGLAWSPAGDEVWFTAGERAVDRALYAVTLSGQQRLLARVAGALTVLDVAADRRVLATTGFGHLGIAGLAPGETRERELGVFNRSGPVALAADGSTVLIAEWAVYSRAVYLKRTDNSATVRLAAGVAAMTLSPDGTHAAVLSDKGLYELPTGPGEPRSLDLGTLQAGGGVARWSADARRLFIAAHEPARPQRVYMREGERPWRAVTPEGVSGGPEGFVAAPDGDRLAMPGPAGNLTLYPVAGGPPREVPGAVGTPVHWTADGASLYMRRSSQAPAVIDELQLATGQVRPIRELMPVDPTGVTFVNPIYFSRDGASYVYGYSRLSSALYLVDNLR